MIVAGPPPVQSHPNESYVPKAGASLTGALAGRNRVSARRERSRPPYPRTTGISRWFNFF